MNKIYLTPIGAEKFKLELKKLLYEERPKLVQTVTWAASNGDRSENGDYLYGKKRLREIDRRIKFLSDRLQNAEIVSHEEGLKLGEFPSIRFGATVLLEDENHKIKRYQLVGRDEIDPALGRISFESPVGLAMLNKKQGDVITVKTPGGEQEFEILKVEYIEII